MKIKIQINIKSNGRINAQIVRMSPCRRDKILSDKLL